MNKQESLALLAEGRADWNAWANDLLAERARLEEAGEWEAAEAEWEARARVDFDDHEFEDDVSFGEFIFPGDAQFNGATFSGNAWFGDATFSGYAWFGGAKFSGTARFGDATFAGTAGFGDAAFSGDAWFNGATFSDDARFGDATFSGIAWFAGATFSRDAGFGQTKFTGYSSFRNTHFLGNVTFAATEVKSAFSLEGAVFELVPDFNQAHFDEAPRLDSLRIEPGASSKNIAKSNNSHPRKTLGNTSRTFYSRPSPRRSPNMPACLATQTARRGGER